MKSVLRSLLPVLAGAGFLFSGCGGGGETPVTPGIGALMGTVKNTSGAAVAGVTVTVSGLPAVVGNDQGWFSVQDVDAGEDILVTFTKTGYVPAYKLATVADSANTFLEVVMAPVGYQTTIMASAGGTVSDGGLAAVTISADTLVDADKIPFNGQARVSVTAFDPTIEAHLNAFPGNFEGFAADGTMVPLLSYGFLDVTVTDSSGNPLQLADGATAVIRGKIPASALASAPATIPLWYFNPDQGRWEEVGEATKDGDYYEATITHFSVWNWDVAYPAAWITGIVVDGEGNPLSGASVTVIGDRWKSGETYTQSSGRFRVPANVNSAFRIWAAMGTAKSAEKNGTTPGANEEIDIGELVIGSGSVKATIALTWGADPSDLDSHLATAYGEHLYYSDKTVTGAQLDTDDTSGYGPEIVTITRVADGMYRYSVHHFAGSGTISSSGARATMMVNGLGMYSLTPPAGAPANGVWELWRMTASGGRIISVETVNQYTTSSAVW